MNSLSKIDRLWQDSLARVDSTEYRGIADALAARGSEVLHAMADLSVANGVSPSMRIRAAAIVFAVHARLTKTDQKVTEAETIRERAKARRAQFEAKKHRAKVDLADAKRIADKKAERRSRRLAEALTAVEQQTGGTNER